MLALPNEPLPGQVVRASDTAGIIRYLKSTAPRTSPGSLSGLGAGGATRTLIVRPRSKQWPLGAGAGAWPFKVYNTTVATVGQVQINGADGFVASLNGFVANVNGNPNNVSSGGPPATFPQLSISGDGVIYGYAVPQTAGTAAPLMSLDIYYGGTLPSPDTANPATYEAFLIATVSNYATDDSGNVSFTLSNATNYGWTTLIYCLGAIQIY
jgi:hypothetical protein